MEAIIQYIKEKYNPLSLIVYGSYANKTNNLNSDFDALVISSSHKQYHDTSFVSGIQLDVFVYPVTYFDNDFNDEDFVQIFDGNIMIDHHNIGQKLQSRIQDYLKNRQMKTKEDLQADINWCIKMYERTKRDDVEGMFRWHWVLVDSLEIFCDIMHHPYYGPKKTLLWMKETEAKAYHIYEQALRNFSEESLQEWVTYLKNMND